MKKRIVSLFLALCLIIAIPTASSNASQYLCFTAVNDTLLTLRDATMPAYFRSKLYVPANVFTEFSISCGTAASQDNLYVYRSGETPKLTFFISIGLVLDQDGATYENVGLEVIDGLYFLPLDFICEFFGLSYSLLTNDPVSVLRITDSNASLNDRTFLGYYKKEIEQAYKDYSTPSTSTPTPNVTTPLETPAIQDYSDITVYLSFYGIDSSYVKSILKTLDEYSVTACFFLSISDIKENPDLIRRISGEKHMVGIWLESAEFDEYVSASNLLFEAAKLVTPIVASDPEIAGDTRAMCDEYGLLYRTATIEPNDNDSAASVTALLSQTPFISDDVRFRCTQNTTRILSAIIRYLENYKYTVSMITETAPLI